MTKEVKKAAQQEQVQQEQVQQVQQQENSIDLTITDLSNIKTIIDIAASRGVFKPAEMTAIGTVYNKLAGFLEAAEKAQKQGQAEPVQA